jgi:hypothetical protein
MTRKLCKKLTSIVACFWWGGDDKKRKIHRKKSGSILLYQKEDGGICFNSSTNMLTGTGMDIAYLDLLCIKVLRACSVNPHNKGIGGYWSVLAGILNYTGLNPPHYTSNLT